MGRTPAPVAGEAAVCWRRATRRVLIRRPEPPRAAPPAEAPTSPRAGARAPRLRPRRPSQEDREGRRDRSGGRAAAGKVGV